MARDQPIGYWVRALDEALTNRMNAVLADQALTRSHWQVLNLVKAGVPSDELARRMRSFVDEEGLAGILGDLRRRGWVTPDPGPRLSALGRAGYDEVAGLVDATRRQTTSGISEDDYATTVRTLQQMLANLQ